MCVYIESKLIQLILYTIIYIYIYNYDICVYIKSKLTQPMLHTTDFMHIQIYTNAYIQT